MHSSPILAFALLATPLLVSAAAEDGGQEERAPVYPDLPEGAPPVAEVEGAAADDEASMKRYRESIPGTKVTFEMVPVPGGTFLMGSPDGEEDRKAYEGPQNEVSISPFWMEVHEVTWDEYHTFMLKLDQQVRETNGPTPQDPWSDAVSRPTPPYVPMDFQMGTEGTPAICMTQFAAKQYTKWLSMKTGRFYRLPTEAEWEYACRAGTKTAYSWGDDPDEIEAYAWYFDNADDQYQPVMKKKPNPWGLFDMHGNVAEWVLDGFDKDTYDRAAAGTSHDPVVWPTELYPRVVRGGSWDDDPDALRSAARRRSNKGWKVQDPQAPKSIWYHTDARFVGFRIVRPLTPPPLSERALYWDADLDSVRTIQERQRRGER
jgi:formylglycine-generating enzyme required for sulfatase activity